MKWIVLLLTSLLAAACVSVPRDAGLAEVTARAMPRVQPDADGVLTADEAVAVAMTGNPRLQVALAELGIARADLIEASTIANPVLEFELRVPGEPYRPYELRLAQSLVDLLTLPRRRAAGRAAFDAAQLGVTATVLRFGTDVRAAYFNVLAATQHVTLSRTSLEAARAAAEVALKQHAVENITDLDLENEQARYEQAKLDFARAERELTLARETLTRALGTSEWRVPETFPALSDPELDPQQLEQQAAQQRLDVAIARRELEIAQRRIPLARLAVLGDAEVDVHYEREPSGERTVGPGIVVPIPIFDTGRATRTRAEAEFLRAKNTLEALLRESSSRLRTVHATLAEARARVEYYRDVVVPRRARIVELTKLEHNAMLVGVFQLLEAKQNEMQARRDFIDAQRDYWSARTELDRAVQGIGEDN
jgi:outer membrane protein, heavy metal efflux system